MVHLRVVRRVESASPASSPSASLSDSDATTPTYYKVLQKGEDYMTVELKAKLIDSRNDDDIGSIKNSRKFSSITRLY